MTKTEIKPVLVNGNIPCPKRLLKIPGLVPNCCLVPCEDSVVIGKIEMVRCTNCNEVFNQKVIR